MVEPAVMPFVISAETQDELGFRVLTDGCREQAEPMVGGRDATYVGNNYPFALCGSDAKCQGQFVTAQIMTGVGNESGIKMGIVGFERSKNVVGLVCRRLIYDNNFISGSIVLGKKQG